MTLFIRPQQFVRHQSERIGDMKNRFDQVVVFLNNPANDRKDGIHVLTVTCNDLAGVMAVQSFNHPDMINHPFFLLVSNTFIMLLTKLTFVPLTKDEEQCFDGISLFINALCLYKNHVSTCFYTDNTQTKLQSYDKIFFTDLFIKKFVRICKNDLSINEYEAYDIKYKVLGRLLHLFGKLNYTQNESIIDAILQCIESKIYVNLYKTIPFSQPTLTPKQSFFMYQCPKFLCLCRNKQQDGIIYELCKTVVGYGSTIFEKHLPVIFGEGDDNDEEDPGAKVRAVAWYVKLLNHFALIPATRVCFIEKRSLDKSMIDQIIMILRTQSLIKSALEHSEFFHADVMLISYSITLLYNLTFEKKIFFELKTDKIIRIFKTFYEAKDRTIQFAAQTLYEILQKEDIDEMTNPTQVARSYLYMIEHTIDDLTLTYHGIRLEGVITNLEDIVQNDEVKEEITNDEEGIPLLARCVYEENLDRETIQRPALRIIDAVSFASDRAVQQIKENDLLMDYIKNLAKNPNEPEIQEVNRLLWKVEEKEFILRQDDQHKQAPVPVKRVFDEKKAIYQYVRGDHQFLIDDRDPLEEFDLLISYCHGENGPEEIYNRLTSPDVNYRVAFDKDNKHNSDPQAMATAVDKSDIIIICFSKKYRNSYACRLEAEYAKKRNKKFIWVKIDKDYQPSGWLTEIDQTIDFIDFNSLGLKKTCDQLIERINE